MRKNIIVIAKYGTSEKEGFETRTHILCDEISKWSNVKLIFSDSNHKARFNERSNSIRLFAENDNFERILIPTFQYTKSASISRVLSWLDFEMKVIKNVRKFADMRTDTVLISSLSLFSVLSGLYIKYRFHARLVMEVRDVWPLIMTEEAGFRRWHPLVVILAWLEKLGYRKSDAIIATMPNLGEHVRSILGFEKEVVCVPFGITESDIEKRPLRTREGTNILYAGSIGITNGLDTFMDTILRFSEEFNKRDINFHFAGQGDKLEEYKLKLSHLKNVTFYGNLDMSNLRSLIMNVDVAYFSSVNSKAYDYGWSPNKLILYMRFGLPVIAGYTGYKSMINEAKCGIFINPENLKEIKKAILHFSAMSKVDLHNLGVNGSFWLKENRLWSKLAQAYFMVLIDSKK